MVYNHKIKYKGLLNSKPFGVSMIAIISLGFDVTHAVFTVTKYRPSKIIVLLALVKGKLDPRTSLAYSSLEQVASAMNAKIEKVEIEVFNPFMAVNKVRSVLESAARTAPLLLDLGGGLRLLVIETLLAYFSLPGDLRENSKIVVYVEGTNETVELTPIELKRLLLRRPRVLSEIEEIVLKVMEEHQEYTLEQIYRGVKLQGFSRSKQYVLKVLRKLEKEGFVVRTGRGKYVKIASTG